MIAVAESMTREKTRKATVPKARQAVEVRRAVRACPPSSQNSQHPKSRKGGSDEVSKFTGSVLAIAGFVGWCPLEVLRSRDLPSSGGVYVVVHPGAGNPTFAPKNCGGWFKGKDPSVSLEALAANWVEGAEVVYIGKADHLSRRLTQFADFGAGRIAPHWGGRLIWQLPNVTTLRVAWKETPGRVPVEVEADLITLFRQLYGKPPFANAPHQFGL